MFSGLQATFPVLTDNVHMGRWIKKIFTWKTNRKSPQNTTPDSRECYRLDMRNLHPLNAAFATKTRAVIDASVLNLSASGLAGVTSHPELLSSDQVFTLVFVLPLAEPILIKTEAHLVAVNPNESPDSKVLHIEFSKDMKTRDKDMIHGYIVKQQFDMIQKRKKLRSA